MSLELIEGHQLDGKRALVLVLTLVLGSEASKFAVGDVDDVVLLRGCIVEI